nr:hypothetical protein [Thermanaerosceptrum fracticalcis]
MLNNPTVVVITDRNDLDDQLFDTFAASAQILKQPLVQAESREHLKELLRVASGGIIFTIIQKFLPVYDIAQAVEDGATVRIYYESRLAKVNLDEEGRRLIEELDAELEETDELTEAQKARPSGQNWRPLSIILSVFPT